MTGIRDRAEPRRPSTEAVLASLEPLLVEATPRDLAAVLRAGLAAAYEGITVAVRLVDYQQLELVSVDGDEPPVAVDGTPAGHCYTAQACVVDARSGGVRVHVPVSHRGDRLGVLDLTLPPGTAPDLDGLRRIGAAVARALLLAGSHSDHFERIRRAQPLTVAAELQWGLLPGRSHVDASVSVAGMLEPAYSVAGDSFDWACDGEHADIAVYDGNGRGLPAAIATSVAVTALRNARRAGLGVADQAALADQALFAHYGGERFVCAGILRLDLRTGTATVVNAGAERLILQRGAEITRVELEPDLPLGMFEESLFGEQPLQLQPGDRLLLVSDGLAGAAAQGSEVDDVTLPEALLAARGLPAAEAARLVMRAYDERRGETPPEDDAVVLCLDWHPPAG